MKKNYIAPHTEAIELLGTNAIMAGSGFNNPNIGWSDGSFNGPGN